MPALIASSPGVIMQGMAAWNTVAARTSYPLATPVMNDDLVIIQTIDNRLVALARFDGRHQLAADIRVVGRINCTNTRGAGDINFREVVTDDVDPCK